MFRIYGYFATFTIQFWMKKGSNERTNSSLIARMGNQILLQFYSLQLVNLAEKPDEIYRLSSFDFESVMAEMYRKLGYDVQQTKSTRDGGKDLIITEPSSFGDFIYYVECKKYSPKYPIGVGIVRNLVGTINTDRVNAGIIATTSFLSRDARKFIIDNNLTYQIKTHDFERIKELLNRI